MKIERMVTVDENGLRLAEKNYPPALQNLWRDYVKNPKAIDRFLAERKGKGPIINEVKDDANSLNVTYLYYGDENTEKVEVTVAPIRASAALRCNASCALLSFSALRPFQKMHDTVTVLP
jgi:hypothetical protein